ncbi:MAG: class II glutamine amidotransferase, partial [Nitrososphaerales archaeon]
WEQGVPKYLAREPTNAFSDSKFEQACALGEKSGASSPLIAHLRKASMGLKIAENTHPFVNGGWAFAHNGTIRKLGLRVTTDSLWFFQGIMREYAKNGGDFLDAINMSVQSIYRTFPYTSLTFLASDGGQLYAYRDASRNAEYYAIYYATLRHSVVITQEKYFEADWKELPNKGFLSVDRELKTDVVQLSPEIIPRVS